MQYFLFAILALLIVFPFAFLAVLFHRRAARQSRLNSRRRFNELVAFDRARRAQQWATLPADGIPGIVLMNAADPAADPLRRAPPLMFAEVAPGIWRRVNGGRSSGNSNNSRSRSGGDGSLQEGAVAAWQPQNASLHSSSRQPAEVHEAFGPEAHTPYGSTEQEARSGATVAGGRRDGATTGSGGVSADVGAVAGKPVAMEDAANTMPTVAMYGEAAYITRAPIDKGDRQISMCSATVESESVVQPSRALHPFTEPSEDHEEVFKSS
jgi:hypothetical protein